MNKYYLKIPLVYSDLTRLWTEQRLFSTAAQSFFFKIIGNKNKRNAIALIVLLTELEYASNM